VFLLLCRGLFLDIVDALLQRGWWITQSVWQLSPSRDWALKVPDAGVPALEFFSLHHGSLHAVIADYKHCCCSFRILLLTVSYGQTAVERHLSSSEVAEGRSGREW
jgi:hypothetical protein